MGSGGAPRIDELQNCNADQGMIKIIIKRVGSSRAEDSSLELFVSQEASVLDLKRKIAGELAVQKNEEQVPVERQRLIFAGRLLVDDHSLVDDVKMTVDLPNYVHLAPIPEGVEPSNRRSIENAGSSVARRPSRARGRGILRPPSREFRRSQESPYGGAIDSLLSRLRSEDSRRSSEPARSSHDSASRAALQQLFYSQLSGARQTASLPTDVSMNPMFCQEHVLITAIPTVMPVSQVVLSLDSSSLGINQGPGVDTGRDVWQRTNELLPLARVLPEQLIRSLTTAGSNSDHLWELRYQTELEETATLLDQVAQRGAELSSSLRRFIYARRALAQSSLNPYGALSQYDTGSYQDPYARF